MNRFTFLFSIIALLAVTMKSPAQESADVAEKGKKCHIGFSGVLPMGVATTALKNSVSFNSSYGFGLIIDRKFGNAVGLFFDANFYTYKINQVDQGGYAQSIWTVEQYTLTDAGAMNAGPFQTDVNFYMQSTGFRIGGKYFLHGEKMSPWIGAALGYYVWNANYANSKKDKTYGNDEGYLFGYSLLAGVDFKIMDMTLTFFGDFGSPVARPLIKDLFYPGWTWNYSNHIMGPTRIGITLYFQ
ncbi:MAG: hypothetical protein GXO83_11350 [Chlorobi bacterium]|nr:hypothetical protein [Chlorobiota bacterium]